MEKPLDVLKQVREKKILIKLKDNKKVIGNLRAFDLHLNIWVSDAEINGKKVSDMLIKGHTILYISSI
ncbi:MAG: small nuclear ribonucleoprotein [Candidatus Aenigmarchaeota archaeon]|nr:small nuclear ribonucleoprotein [Candidatus Aenigmarchaeota archaeon]